MTLTIDLTPETERRMRRLAAASGESVEEYLLHLLSRLPDPPVSSEHQATEALFQQWAKEDETLTPAEVEKEDEDWRKIEADLQTSRLTLPVAET